jgi:endogenous inhibitor of DNA gyrase (YacG/DUF329 family)
MVKIYCPYCGDPARVFTQKQNLDFECGHCGAEVRMIEESEDHIETSNEFRQDLMLNKQHFV